MTPVVSRSSADFIQGLVKVGLERGAKGWVGEEDGSSSGWSPGDACRLSSGGRIVLCWVPGGKPTSSQLNSSTSRTGPLTRPPFHARSLVQDAEEKGATLSAPFRREGNLIWPLVVDNITNDMR